MAGGQSLKQFSLSVGFGRGCCAGLMDIWSPSVGASLLGQRSIECEIFGAGIETSRFFELGFMKSSSSLKSGFAPRG